MRLSTLPLASICKFDVLGTLRFGADADFIMINVKDLVNGDMDILSTWINGQKVYSAC